MEKKKESTLRCIAVLTIIAVVCGVLLAVLYPLLYVAPSLDSIENNVTAAELGLPLGATLDWKQDKLNEERIKASGGTVLMTASAESEGDTFYGVLIKTKPAAKLGETTFAMFFRKSDERLVKAVVVEDGATSGRTYEFALENDKQGKVRSFDYYYKVVDKPSDAIFGAFDKPKCGATYTVTAVDNAFRIAADYYYYTYGGGAQ